MKFCSWYYLVVYKPLFLDTADGVWFVRRRKSLASATPSIHVCLTVIVFAIMGRIGKLQG